MEKFHKEGKADKKSAFQLQDIARPVENQSSWEDLNLPKAMISVLKDICTGRHTRDV